MKNSIKTADPRAFLPKGKTCADCMHHDRCKMLLGIDGTENACDWIPSKFSQKPTHGPHPNFFTCLNKEWLTEVVCRHCLMVQPDDKRVERHADFCRLFTIEKRDKYLQRKVRVTESAGSV